MKLTNFITLAAKHLLNSNTITITNPLKIIEKLTPLNYQKPFGKQSGQSPEIRWKIIQHITPYQCGSKTCNLCLSEKLLIFQADPKNY